MNEIGGLRVGYRFKPTDVDLLYYLMEKTLGRLCIGSPDIRDWDIYTSEPWRLHEVFGSSDKCDWYMYFFVLSRRHRNAGNGYWKASVGSKDIKDNHNNGQVLGVMRTLVYYQYSNIDTIDSASASASRSSSKEACKTNWIMHEYKLLDGTNVKSTSSNQGGWALCKIGKTGRSKSEQSNYQSTNEREGFLEDSAGFSLP